MAKEKERGIPSPANDNAPATDEPSSPAIDAAVVRIARLIGRQMAREAFERQSAANDNAATPSAE